MSQQDGADPYWSDRPPSERTRPGRSDALADPYGSAGPYASAGFGANGDPGHGVWDRADGHDLPGDDPRTGGSAHSEPSWSDDVDAAARAWRDESATRAEPTGTSAEPEPERPKSRTGRNVPMSILVGVLLLTVVLTPLFLAKPIFIAIVAIAAGVGIWEMCRAVRASGAKPPLVPLLVGAVAMFGLAWFSGIDGLSIGLLISALAIMVWRMADGPAGYQRDMGAAALIVVYVPFLLGFAVLLARPDDGAWRIVVTLAAVVLSDTGGFVAGVLFGKHPMAPTISPKKSWEGFAGSMVAASVGSAILLSVLLDVKPYWGAAFGLVVAVAAVLGDLAESLLKRDLGIKDMSNLLPGHGGLMDRLDSILFAVPTAYLLLSVLAPVP